MRCPAGPFDLVPALRKDWGPRTVLNAGAIEIDENPATADRSALADEPSDDRAGRIVEALKARPRRRVALESAVPLNDLARAVWVRAGDDLRKRLSVATLAYTNDNHFTLLILPTLGSAELEPETWTPERIDAIPTATATAGAAGQGAAGGDRPSGRGRAPSRRVILVGVGSLALAGIALGSIAMSRGRGHRVVSDVAVVPGRTIRAVAAPARPSGAEAAAQADDDQRARVAEGLIDLAERFGLAESVPPDAIASPAMLMRHLCDHLRYRGPRLTDEQCARLREDGGEEARRALEWDAHLEHFADDRPLPEGFDTGPLDWQLRTLAWTFGVTPHPDQVATELPFAMAEALALPGPAVRPSGLEAEYPPLGAYARFLSRLPRR
jgi:hypothetical protein